MKNEEKAIKKDIIVEWLKKHNFCGNKTWYDDKVYYSLTLDNICDLVIYVNQKSSIVAELKEKQLILNLFQTKKGEEEKK